MSIPSISYLIGGFVEGLSLSNILYGISIAQAYVYMQSWKNDPKWMKLLAVAVVLLETVNVIFILRQQYFYSVSAIGQPTMIATIDWSVPVALTFEIMAEILVQGFYIYRMWVFSKNLLLMGSTTICLICRYAFMIYAIVDMFKVETWVAEQSRRGFGISYISAVAFIMATDVLITSTMIYYLYARRTYSKQTQSVMVRLIAYFVNTGAILNAFSAAGLICYLVQRDSLLFCTFVVIYARSLANALFGMLNARQLLRTKSNDVVTFGGGSMFTDTTNNQKVPVKVQVGREVMNLADRSDNTLGHPGSDGKTMLALSDP